MAFDKTHQKLADDVAAVDEKTTRLIAATEAVRKDLADLKATITGEQVDPVAEETILAAVDAIGTKLDTELAAIAAIPPGGGTTPPVVDPSGTVKFGLTNASLPETLQSGGKFTLEVNALDKDGGHINGYLGAVDLTSDASASLPARYQFLAEDAGTKQFSVTVRQLGSVTITATDSANPSISGTLTQTVVP